ncbi:hypothetical protein Cni_G06514 [Canna indica]|uniref:Transmembrane protein n=1 Tax=Canna indica TaxID=4628 RepID=A0AAQ3JXD9_9LILI|nr:hypothetical protein Cni_G06514 [Canna indica]
MASLPQPTQICSYSKGSFGPVFIVLAVIAVLAIGACVAGRLCSLFMSEPKPQRRYHPRAVKDDMENGLEFKVPTLKPPAAAAKDAKRESQTAAEDGAAKGSAVSGISKGANNPGPSSKIKPTA